MKVLLMSAMLASVLAAQVLYEEHFTSGAMQVPWHAWFTDSAGLGDSMSVITDPTTPGGDGWAGRISNEYMGVAGLTYAGIGTLTDYSIDAWIFTIVTSGSTSGPYNGISIRMDPNSRYYYRLVADFDDNARLRLGYVGSGGMPTAIRDWTSGEIPGGVPSTSSWHKMKLMMIADSIWAYYDNVLLPSCPLIHDSVAMGHFGIYTFNMMDTASTKCDDIIIRAEASAVMEHNAGAGARITLSPAVSKGDITISLPKVKALGASPSINIYNVTGRLVKSFALNPSPQALGSLRIFWQGDDNSGNAVPAGIYFIGSESLAPKVTGKIVLVR